MDHFELFYKKIFSKFIMILFLSNTILLSAYAETASVPSLINYQGLVTDKNGSGINGNKKFEFRLYDSLSGGNVIWGPQVFDNVPVIAGQFNVILGITDINGKDISLAFNSIDRYLGIKYGDSASNFNQIIEISPRQKVLSVPFSIQSEKAKWANNGFGFSPIGAIIAWHKSFSNLPDLPDGWMECNGQIINDPDSPFYNQKLPDLNTKGKFLRGASNGQSGTMQEMDWKSFYIAGFKQGHYTHDDVLIPKKGYNEQYPFGGKFEGPGNLLRFKFDESEVRPTNMSIIWIMRIK